MKALLTTISPSALIAQLITGCFAIYLLAVDNVFGLSISAIIHYAHSLEVSTHILVLGLLPVYIAAVIFGAALIGAYLSRKIDPIVRKCCKK